MNQTALITGAGSGFGLGASIELARRGYDVIATTQILAQITGVKAAAEAAARLTAEGRLTTVAGGGDTVLIDTTGLDRVVAFDPTTLRSASEVTDRLRALLVSGALVDPDGTPILFR